jgi:hypothetical protein
MTPDERARSCWGARLRKRPTPSKMLEIGRRGQLDRSLASWFLWASLAG